MGYLIVRTTYLPRILGALMALSGLGWLTVLSPELLRYTRAYVEIIGIAAEGSLLLWLLIMGVNVRQWNEQAKSDVPRWPSQGRHRFSFGVFVVIKNERAPERRFDRPW